MEYKPTTKIVLPRGNGKSIECLKELCKIFYKVLICVFFLNFGYLIFGTDSNIDFYVVFFYYYLFKPAVFCRNTNRFSIIRFL